MRSIIYLLIGMSLLMSCSGNKPESTDGDNVVIVRSMFDAFNKHDWEAMADHYVDSASFLDPSFGKEYVIQSKTALVNKYAEMQQFLPDIHDEIVGLYPSEDKVTVEFISTGTMPDGAKFSLPITSILTVKGGKIVKDATYYDQEDQ